jgi:hypothetical protein
MFYICESPIHMQDILALNEFAFRGFLKKYGGVISDSCKESTIGGCSY